jgi:hypothetical protein
VGFVPSISLFAFPQTTPNAQHKKKTPETPKTNHRPLSPDIMRGLTAIVAAFAALAGSALAAPQAVTGKISPTAAAPPSCTGAVSGKFEVTIIELSKRDLAPQVDVSSFASNGTANYRGLS